MWHHNRVGGRSYRHLVAPSDPAPRRLVLSRRQRLGRLLAAALCPVAVAGCAVLPSEQALGAPASTEPSSLPIAATTVVRVVDGDTVEVAGAVDDVVRVLGIDTPETVHPTRPVECWGPEASALARELLQDQPVTLTSFPGADDHDRYDRRLAVLLFADGRDYGLEALRAGTARVYDDEDTPEEYRAAERDAAERNAGLWERCE